MTTSLENLYIHVKNILTQARATAYRSTNVIMVEAYWQIGRMIVEEEQGGKDRAAYGKHVLQFLSKRLTTEFGEGFDQSNLRYMRKVYTAFPIRDALRHELSWTHYRHLSKVENEQARLLRLLPDRS